MRSLWELLRNHEQPYVSDSRGSIWLMFCGALCSQGKEMHRAASWRADQTFDAETCDRWWVHLKPGLFDAMCLAVLVSCWVAWSLICYEKKSWILRVPAGVVRARGSQGGSSTVSDRSSWRDSQRRSDAEHPRGREASEFRGWKQRRTGMFAAQDAADMLLLSPDSRAYFLLFLSSFSWGSRRNMLNLATLTCHMIWL